MKNRLIIKKEAILIVSVLLLALVMLLLYTFLQHKGDALGEIDIYINGKLSKTLTIEEGKTYDIVNGDNINTLQFTKNGVLMLYSTCSNQLCVHQGEVNNENYHSRLLLNRIICLPNAVVIELKIGDQKIIDSPDV